MYFWPTARRPRPKHWLQNWAAQLIVPADSTYLGNPKSCIGIKIRSPHANSKLHIELAETPFFAHSVSEFILPESGKEYLVFPDVIWNYQALLENTQAMPVTVSIQAKVNNNRTYSAVHTYSVRSKIGRAHV